MQILRHLCIIYKLLKLDSFEKKFITKNKSKKNNTINKYILIQLVEDYYYVYYIGLRGT